MTDSSSSTSPTVLGHPPGLFALFFAEMWERFSYYGMRALLVFYMLKGFLGYGDDRAYAVYGAYTGLVYATPFIGGMLADRLLGQRLAVVWGGLLMAAGHMVMTVQSETMFFMALALLIVGNGFFKPNISTMVGSLYGEMKEKKDAGFTIFYMGINLGAAISPIVCGYVGEKYGWHYGFGLATVGMLLGVAVFVAPTQLTRVLILIGSILTAVSMFFLQDSLFQLLVRIFLGGALLTAATVAFQALGKGGLPGSTGLPPDPDRLKSSAFPNLRKLGIPYSAAALALAVVSLLLTRLVFTSSAMEGTAIAISLALAASLPWLSARSAVFAVTALIIPVIVLILKQDGWTGYILAVFWLPSFGFLIFQAFLSNKVDRERMFVVLILTFFSFLFWMFFEQAGSSMNNFADRNVDRVLQDRVITDEDVGKTITFRVPFRSADAALAKLPVLGQEQLGYNNGTEIFTMSALTELRDATMESPPPPDLVNTVDWKITPDHVGMGIGGAEVPASEFQAANPIFILIFGLVFSALWTAMATRKIEPSTPLKFSLALLQLGLGFVVLWYGAKIADDRGMVAMTWLILAYMLHTTGELCLSPVGLSMVTRLSPAKIVSTVMGAWFLAAAYSNIVAGYIASLTSVAYGGEEGTVPPPQDTVGVYGEVFGKVGLTAIAAALICLILTPLLKRWMHQDVPES